MLPPLPVLLAIAVKGLLGQSTHGPLPPRKDLSEGGCPQYVDSVTNGLFLSMFLINTPFSTR